MAACQNLYMMMTRVKSRPLPSLVSKKALENQKFGRTCLQLFAITCTAAAFGILVVVQKVGENLPICLSTSMIVAILSGLCVTEFLTSHAQGCQSVYSCLYQSVSEISAYIIGWTWILSLSATLAATCKVLSSSVDHITHQQVSEFIKSTLSPTCPDVLSVALVATVAILSITGISYSTWWLVLSMPAALLMAVSVAIGFSVISDKSEWMAFENVYRNLGPEELLTGTSLCYCIFMGPHSALRLPLAQVHCSVSKVFGVLNILCYLVVLTCGSLLSFTLYNVQYKAPFLSDRQRSDILTILSVVPLCLLSFEQYQPLLMVTQDMSSDGLLFRCLAKRWKPFCQKVSSSWMFFLTAVLTGALTLALPLAQILNVTATAPLVINTVVTVAVLTLRYKYSDAWKYEPMLQNGAAAHHHSRKRSTEFLPSSELNASNAANKTTESSDSEESSGTDIDAVVQEYKESIQLANLDGLESTMATSVVHEPTSSSSFQAKLLIFAHVTNCVVLAVCSTVAARSKMTFDIVLVCVVSLTVILSVIFMCLLGRLPQNKPSSSICGGKKQTVVPFVPWVPGLAVLLSLCLLVHVLVDVWYIVLCWIILGLFLYFVYGMRNSTAASSFYGIPLTARVSLQPFPDANVRQVTLPEKKNKKKAKRKVYMKT